MKKWMAKKIMPMLLSVSLALGMIGVPLSVNAGTDSEGAVNADIGGEGVGGGKSTDSGGAADAGIDDAGAADVDAGLKTENFERGNERSTDAEKKDAQAELIVEGQTPLSMGFIEAWKKAQKMKGPVTIRLLESLNLDNAEIENPKDDGSDGINDDARHTLEMWSGDIILEMENGVQLYNSGSQSQDAIINVRNGNFTLRSGQISVESNISGVYAFIVNGGNVFIGDGSDSNIIIKSTGGIGLRVCSPTASISGGTFEGGEYAVQCDYDNNNNVQLKIKDILANGYAFQEIEGSKNWIDNMEATSIQPKVKAEQYPVKFTKDPESKTIVYGDSMPNLYAEALVTQPDAVGTNTVTYQWFIESENGEKIEVGQAAAEPLPYTPENKNAGTYDYYCQATAGWFSLYSKCAVVKIEPRPLNAVFQGEIVKTYDGTTNVDASRIPPFILDGVQGADTVTTSAIQAAYPSPDPGLHDVEVKLASLEGADAHNYKISEPVTAKGRIDPLPVQNITLNKDNLSLIPGGSAQLTVTFDPENGTDKTIKWSSSNPSVAVVDGNGRVTAVGAGSAVITAATPDGRYVKVCSVTVISTSSGSSGWYSGTSSSSFKQPFIKGSPAKWGWYVIRTEAVKAADLENSTLTIDMNGTTVVPGSFFHAVRGRKVTAVFELSSGLSWSVNGQDITAETLHDIDFSVKVRTNAIPKECIDQEAGSCEHLELNIPSNEKFGFTAALTVRIVRIGNSYVFENRTGDTYAGMYANLFCYNSALRRLEFICEEKIGEDGTVRLPFSSAADYMIVLSPSAMHSQDTPDDSQEGTKPQEPQEDVLVRAGSVKLSKTVYTYSGKAKKPSVTAVDKDGKRIPAKYYSVSYKNNRKVGTALAVIVFKDGYTGTVKKSFTIRPAGTSIKKIQAASSGFTVKWAKKTAQTSGYQIQYSSNAKFQKGSTKNVFVRKANVTKKTVKKLKAGKKYYVRIRTYKTVKTDGKSTKICSAWSRAVRVKLP